MRHCALLILIATAGIASGDEFPVPFNSEPNSEETLMSPEQAAKSFDVPDGFQVSVFAAEPDVQNPIAMTFDARGRLWIAENYTYAERGQRFQLDLRDRVVIFDNATGDRFKKRTVFTDNVQMLTGLEVGRGGVWLLCPPKLIFIPDADGDDAPDGPGEVVLDGFTVAANNYHNFANGLRFGPDGWLYGRCGGSCPGRIGRPGTPDEHRLAMEGGIWRYHPTKRSVEVLTTGTTNPWGHDWNEVGEMFYVNTVNGHLWHMIPGAHFVRPFLLDPNRRTYKLIDMHADHWHFDTGQSWTKSRDGAANAYGGGHAHIGAMIYQGNNWPNEYRGKLFTLNQHGRRANQETLERDGSGYVARHGKDILLSKDIWFQGIDLASGPDGAVFIIDWSDTGECHEHTGVHRQSGRIFKVTHQSAESARKMPHDLTKLDAKNLAPLLIHPDPFLRRQARLLLSEDQNNSNFDIEAVFSNSTANDRIRVQTLLAAAALGRASENYLRNRLDDPSEHVRAWAIRLLTDDWPIDDTHGPGWKTQEQNERTSKAAKKLMPELVRFAARDDSAFVRLVLASTLQRLPVSMRTELATELVSHAEDASDHNLPMMIWYGLIPVADKHALQLAEVAKNCKLPDTLHCIARCLGEEIERQPQALELLLQNTADSVDARYQQTVLNGVAEALKGWQQAPKPKSWDRIARLKNDSIANQIRELSVVFGDGRAVDQLKNIALGKTNAEHNLRLDALRTLIQSNAEGLRGICEQLLKDSRMNVLAAQGLSKFDDPKIGKAIVARYRNFRAPFRPQVISVLSSRATFAKEMLHAIADGKIPRDDLSAYQVRQILGFDDEQATKLVRNVWGEIRDTPQEKLQIIAKLKRSLTSKALSAADKHDGRRLFEKSCQACHRLYGVGGKVGPDLTGSNRDNLDYLLSNIVDPSAVVDKNYRMTQLLLEDGRFINGMVIDETEKSIKIHTATEEVTIPADDVIKRKVTEKSPMPDGLIDNLTDRQIRNLISYLAHPSQVPLSKD